MKGPAPPCVARLVAQQRALGISDEQVDRLIATSEDVLVKAAWQALLKGREDIRDLLLTVIQCKRAARAHRAETS